MKIYRKAKAAALAAKRLLCHVKGRIGGNPNKVAHPNPNRDRDRNLNPSLNCKP